MKDLSSAEKRTKRLYEGIWELFTDEEYERFARWMWEDYYKLSEPVGTHMTHASVLDAGCGGGALVYTALREDASRVVGVDLSRQALDHTERLVRTYASEKADRIDLRQASVLELPFGDATFDVVYSAGVLHHLAEEPEKGFRELVRVLKPGGIIWVGLYGAGGLLSGVLIPTARALNRIIPEPATRKVLDLFRVSPLRRYEILDAMYVPYRYQYRAIEILGWIDRGGLVEPLRTDIALHPIFKYAPWLNGEGWIGYRATKPMTS
jgi:SAM-dependent methyltransferase